MNESSSCVYGTDIHSVRPLSNSQWLFSRNEQIKSKIYMEIQGTIMGKTTLRKNKVVGLTFQFEPA